MFDDLFDVNSIPSIDLHGEYEVSAKIMINDFIKEHVILKTRYVAIIHGKSGGVLKKVTLDTLKHNKSVLDYKLCYFNDGMTLVKLR